MKSRFKSIFTVFSGLFKRTTKKCIYTSFSHAKWGGLCTLDLHQWLVLLLKSRYEFHLVNSPEGSFFIWIQKTVEQHTKMCKSFLTAQTGTDCTAWLHRLSDLKITKTQDLFKKKFRIQEDPSLTAKMMKVKICVKHKQCANVCFTHWILSVLWNRKRTEVLHKPC